MQPSMHPRGTMHHPELTGGRGAVAPFPRRPLHVIRSVPTALCEVLCDEKERPAAENDFAALGSPSIS
jgi:hypothetical protein